MKAITALFILSSVIYLSWAYSFRCNGKIGQYPNPNDPYSFFKCDSSGRAHIFHCARGTRYDRTTQICDWEDKVMQKSQGGYVDGTYDNYERTNQHGYNCNCYQCTRARQQRQCSYYSTGRCNHPAGYHSNNNNNNLWRTSSSRKGVDCSSQSSYGPPMYFQNPEDCTTYFTCNMGHPILTYCPRGLNFNPKRGGCDDTIQLGCKVRTEYQQGGNAVYEYRRSLPETKNTTKN